MYWIDPQIKIKSFTVTPDSLSITIKKDVKPITPANVIGIDRNLKNITITTPDHIIQYRTEKLLSIKRNSIYARAGFKRNDRRVKSRFYHKIRDRQTRRVNQYLHKISKDVVYRAKQTSSAIIFEDLNGIRKLYRKGNGQGKKYHIMNSWSFYMFLLQVSYKAAWEGIPVYYVPAHGTSKLCTVCGGSLQEDSIFRRKLWCVNCSSMIDRDAVASVNCMQGVQ